MSDKTHLYIPECNISQEGKGKISGATFCKMKEGTNTPCTSSVPNAQCTEGKVKRGKDWQLSNKKQNNLRALKKICVHVQLYSHGARRQSEIELT